MGKCAAIGDDTARLACYDAVASVAPAPVPAKPNGPSAAPAAVAATATAAAVPAVAEEAVVEKAPGPLTDDVGKERVKGADRGDNPQYSAVVTRCEESPSSGQIYFIMENGQVWKQSNYRRLSLRNCQFEVTLTKDAFGYEIYIPEKDRTVRVSRIR